MDVLLIVLGVVAGVAVGAAAGYLLYKSNTEKRQAGARLDARAILEEAERQAQTARREAEVAAKEAALRTKDEAEAEIRSRRAELVRLEERLNNRGGALGGRDAGIEEGGVSLRRR